MTLAITPTHASNKLIIEGVINAANGASATTGQVALFNTDSHATNAIASHVFQYAAANHQTPVSFIHYMAAGVTSATTFRVRIATSGAATTTFNGASGGRIHGGVMASSITITEIQV